MIGCPMAMASLYINPHESAPCLFWPLPSDYLQQQTQLEYVKYKDVDPKS